MKIDSRQEQPNELSTARKFAIKFCLFSGPLSISNLFQFATLIKIHTEKKHFALVSIVICWLLSSSLHHFFFFFFLHFTTLPPNHYQLYFDINTSLKMVLFKQNMCVQYFSLYYSVCERVCFVLVLFCMHAYMHECVSFLYAKIVVVKQNVSQMSLLLLPFYLFAFKPKIENHDKTRRIRRTKHMEKLSEQANERVCECGCESVSAVKPSKYYTIIYITFG